MNIAAAPSWARPTIEGFLKSGDVPGTSREEIPGEQADEFRATMAQTFDDVRAADNSPQDLDPAVGSVAVKLEGTNATNRMTYQGDSTNGTIQGGLCVDGTEEYGPYFFQSFSPTATDTIIFNDQVATAAIHVEAGQGYILAA